MTNPEYPVLFPTLTLHLRANDDRNADRTRCGMTVKVAAEGKYTKTLCLRCFK